MLNNEAIGADQFESNPDATPMPKTLAAHGMGIFRARTLVTVISALTVAVACGTAAAGDQSLTLRQARLCDTSGCYLSWNVVDSDQDGVSDADELIAHTNPFDPLSRPPLHTVVEMAEKHVLSSFEAGLGAFFVFPPELQAMLEKDRDANSMLAGFPFGTERPDALSRLGISSGLLKEHGIDVGTQGLSIGLAPPTKDTCPQPRVGGIAMSWYADDEDLEPLPKDVPVKDETIDGDRFRTYLDGSVKADWADGSFTTMDKDGNVTKRGYINPDADQVSTTPSPEQIKRTLRLRDAAIRTVEGWTTPIADGAEPKDPHPSTFIMVDPDYIGNTALVFEPTVTSAQPETRPDLPSPQVSAGGTPGRNVCAIGC
jgi:hypothetical protein